MYAAGTGGFASSGDVTRTLTSGSLRYHQSCRREVTRPNVEGRFICSMVSGPEHGDAASTIRRWTGQVWSLAGLVGTSSGCRRTVAAALLSREEVVLHLLQAFG